MVSKRYFLCLDIDGCQAGGGGGGGGGLLTQLFLRKNYALKMVLVLFQ